MGGDGRASTARRRLRLTDALAHSQARLLKRWLPGHAAVADHSWGLIGTTVLELAVGEKRYIAKAGDVDDTHIAREWRAHREWLTPFLVGHEVSRLVYGSLPDKLLVLEYLHGDLVQGSGAEDSPAVFAAAGELLARLHGQAPIEDSGYPQSLVARAERWLSVPQRTPQALHKAAARAVATTASDIPTTVLPTHGDYSPRNWLLQEGSVRIIDFGRAELRPAMTDFARLAARWFPDHPELESAFLDGYGADPRTAKAWRAISLCEAIGTVGWAHSVGDMAFEDEGLRELERLLA